MPKGRLEAFTDGVMAIIITIMVLELKVPDGFELDSLLAVVPKLLIYLLSFVFVGIYWMNHHHMLHTTKKITGGILWANLSLLFWLSLFPFVADWMGENLFRPLPSAAYGFILFMAGISYLILQKSIIASDGENSALKKAVGDDRKGKFTSGLIVLAVIFSFFQTYISLIIYILITIIWMVPDRRIEKVLSSSDES
ncbi:MAG TPA: TMEM175 family protein [Anaerolineales bacterium]|nr:TMEM175 family protein [Anaerolineales bacterium]HNN14366.1 TMEM175 family protein [Anaerolineales bacterium]